MRVPHRGGRGRQRRLDANRAAQLLFVLLLAVSMVMVTWWLMDQAAFIAAVNQRLEALYAADAAAADSMLEAGQPPAAVARHFPHLRVGGGGAEVAEGALETLREEQRSHLNQYFWEGAFFLVVLIAGMGVLWRAVRLEVLLRRRQENFLAAVSHELKTPIASLQLATETMALRDPPAPKRRQLLQRNLDDLKRLENMVSNLLETSRIDEGRVELERQPVRLAAAVDQAFAELGYPTVASGVEVRLQLPPDLEIDADPLALGTVLRNLIGNALKATAAVEGSTITVEAEEAGNDVRLRVHDTGVGFEPDEAERLFEKFYRPGDELRRSTAGTGLGLYIVRRLMQLEGGTVAAQSAGPGKGAVFTVAWPTTT